MNFHTLFYFNFELTPRAAWFIQDNFAVGAEVLFDNTSTGWQNIIFTVGFGNSTTTNSLRIGLGFLICLPTSKLEEVQKDMSK